MYVQDFTKMNRSNRLTSNFLERLNDNQKKIYNHLLEFGEFTKDELKEELNFLDIKIVEYEIKKLIRLKAIKKRKYWINGNLVRMLTIIHNDERF